MHGPRHWFLECRWKFSMQRRKKTHVLRDMEWVKGVLAMIFCWLIKTLLIASLHFINEIPADAQINDELYTFSKTFLTKEPPYNVTLEIYSSFPICVCVIFVTAVALPNTRLLRSCLWTNFFKKHKYNIYDMFNLLIKSNERFD